MPIDPDDLELEDLTETIDLLSFDCNDADLNEFFKDDALENQKVYVSKTRLVRYKGEKELTSNSGKPYRGEILGFITLVTDSIERKSVNSVERRYRYLHYPALKIARLGVHCDYKRMGIGTVLLEEAMLSAVSIFHQSHTGCRLVTVDAKPTVEALGFYEDFGFYRALKKDADDCLYCNVTYLGISYYEESVPMYIDYAAYLKLL